MSDSSGEERTQEPTGRRIERWRRAGHVAFSRELVAGFVVAAACVVLAAGGKVAVGFLATYLRAALVGACRAVPPGQAMRNAFDTMLAVLGLPLGTLCVVALVTGLVQTRGSLAGAGLKVAAGRVTPRLGRILGRDGVVALVLDVGKLALLGALACWVLGPCLSAALRLHGADAPRILGALGILAKHLGLYLAVAMVGLGLADYLVQARRYRARLRMTREEARREHREEEGDPIHRAERQRLHRELQLQSSDLREAVLVLVDPGKTAIAIAYSGEASGAPVVVAKGVHLLARRLEALARVSGVPVVIDPELVVAFSGVEAGEGIPEATYVRVAERMVGTRARLEAAEPPSTAFPDRPMP